MPNCDLQILSVSLPRTRPSPPNPNSVVLGTVVRLSPHQATIAISVVDGVPLPAGEEFTGEDTSAGASFFSFLKRVNH